MDQLREYHDALVRLDVLREQLRGHVLAAQARWLGDDEGPPDYLKPFEDIEIRMDEVIPDAVKATRMTATQRAAMVEMARCPDCGGELETGDGKRTPPVYCPQCKQGWDRPEDVPVLVPNWEGPRREE